MRNMVLNVYKISIFLEYLFTFYNLYNNCIQIIICMYSIIYGYVVILCDHNVLKEEIVSQSKVQLTATM